MTLLTRAKLLWRLLNKIITLSYRKSNRKNRILSCVTATLKRILRFRYEIVKVFKKSMITKIYKIKWSEIILNKN